MHQLFQAKKILSRREIIFQGSRNKKLEEAAWPVQN
jgi:hypothetical protein